jgi:hypothetical protein
MKNIASIRIAVIIGLIIFSQTSRAQNHDEERMNKDIEVAENVLATLIKQEFEQQNTFLGIDVRGTYQPGYGVTFRVPDQSMPVVLSIRGYERLQGPTVISDGNGYRYTWKASEAPVKRTAPEVAEANEYNLPIKIQERNKEALADSARLEYDKKVIRAAQNFILDYGDFLSQLPPNERIVVTNQNDQLGYVIFNGLKMTGGKRTRISVEGTRGDATAFRQGKITRDQALKKLTILNTEAVDTREPDMEMLSSIFARLYRPDLSKTYFVDGNVYYERLRDFGAIFYMRVLSSDETSLNRFSIPTLGLENLDLEARDKKVKELYPAFEQDIKENILEYGRTVKSLKDNESLIFNIQMTRCIGCGIPSTLELSVKSSVLKDLDAGRIDKNAALNKIEVKKGAGQ